MAQKKETKSNVKETMDLSVEIIEQVIRLKLSKKREQAVLQLLGEVANDYWSDGFDSAINLND